MFVKATVAWKSMPGTALSTSHLGSAKHAATAPVTVSLAFSKEVSKVSRPMATSLICPPTGAATLEQDQTLQDLGCAPEDIPNHGRYHHLM